MMMKEYYIELTGTSREDGSVLLFSDDLPMFSVIGRDAQGALDLALEILPEYLSANVPEFVDIRTVPSGKQLIGDESSGVLPAHMIARINTQNDAGKPNGP
jgi:hypothetical protein